ncbi:neuropeptide Y receptor type 6-like [Amphiura filiformis]|uniref:neuropeptide Y receptor type 6-like n=1 Tax=Amphiura filiformis TaxID=82378 RepID=UPI003B219CFF
MSTIDASYYTPLPTTSSTDSLFPNEETHQEVSNRETALRIAYSVIGCLGILGNLTVCTVFIIRRRAFNSVTNKLMLNQSCIDLLNSIVFLALRFGPRYLPHNRLGEFLCRFWYNEYFMWCLFHASTFNLVFLSLERYFATCHPVKHRKLFSTKVPKIGIPCVWLAGFTYDIYWVAIKFDYYCYPTWPSKGVQMFMGIFLFTCEYLLPLSIMTFSYVSIIMMLRRRTADRQKATNSAFQKAKKNVTITLCLVFISYVVCWTPTEVSYLMYNLGYPYDFTSTAHGILTVIVLCNMIANPIIYAFKYEHFQKQFQKVFCVCCGKNKVGDSNIASVTVDPAGVETSNDVA